MDIMVTCMNGGPFVFDRLRLKAIKDHLDLTVEKKGRFFGSQAQATRLLDSMDTVVGT